MVRQHLGLSLPRGARVGLLGGSFDPPHAGHLHLSREALKRFGLDRVIWLVSPGNPLKTGAPASMERRLTAARLLADDPRIWISDFERPLGTRFTHETLGAMTTLWPQVRFVWLMGADNLVQFHRWDNWRRIMSTLPVGVLARPGHRMAALQAPTTRAFSSFRIPAEQARLLPMQPAPAWCFVNMPMMSTSSTQIRRLGGWSSGDT